MIPIRDTEPSRTKPIVIKVIIALNALVFLYELGLGRQLEAFMYQFGLVPAAYFYLGQEGPQAYVSRFAPLFTHMFVHGGWLHIGFNMLFLWIFGDNIEDRLGRLRFVVFYLACGLTAAYLQLYLTPDSRLPMIGASGAIAGVMGGYIVLFPRARVLTLVPIFFFLQLVELPAVVFLGFWFVLQFFSGTIMVLEGAQKTGGVASWAHVGGFAAGAALVKLFAKRTRVGEADNKAGGEKDGAASDAAFGGESWQFRR
jgi:membrane associated rhomboid family serine protease